MAAGDTGAGWSSKKWSYSPQSTGFIQGNGSNLNLQSSTAANKRIQGSTPQLQVSSGVGQRLQSTASPMNYVDPVVQSQGHVLGLNTDSRLANPGGVAGGGGFDPAAAKAAADAAQAAKLRGEITQLVNRVKDTFNSRYGQVDASVREKSGQLNQRFTKESGDISKQAEGENQKLGVAHAAGGTFDSSYRGNNQDTVTHAAEGQIGDLGTELKENLGKVGGWGAQQKSRFGAEKGAMDTILTRIAESTDPGELSAVRNQIDAKIAGLQAEGSDNNTMAQNNQALNQIAPSKERAQKLQTTLSQIVAGNADTRSKSLVAQRLITSAGLDPQDEQALLTSFNGEMQKQQQPA